MDNFATVYSGTWTDVNNPVGCPYCVLVVLDDDQCVSQISKFFKSLNQAQVVTLMKANGWLVQNIENSGKAGANLGRQPYSLRLSSGQ